MFLTAAIPDAVTIAALIKFKGGGALANALETPTEVFIIALAIPIALFTSNAFFWLASSSFANACVNSLIAIKAFIVVAAAISNASKFSCLVFLVCSSALSVKSAISLSLVKFCCLDSSLNSFKAISASILACVPALALSITVCSLAVSISCSSASIFCNSNNLFFSSFICSALNLFLSIAKLFSDSNLELISSKPSFSNAASLVNCSLLKPVTVASIAANSFNASPLAFKASTFFASFLSSASAN